MPDPFATGLLVKHAPIEPGLAAQAAGQALEPLFASVGQHGEAIGAAAGAQWSRLAFEPQGAGAAWDRCHAMSRDGLGIAGAPGVVFAEPDLAQTWVFAPP